MNGQELFGLFILTSLLGALASLSMGRWSKACRVVSFSFSTLSSMLGLALALEVLLGSGTVVLALPTAVAGFGTFSFVIDQVIRFFLLAIALSWEHACPLLHWGYTKRYEGKYSLGHGLLFNTFLLRPGPGSIGGQRPSFS